MIEVPNTDEQQSALGMQQLWHRFLEGNACAEGETSAAEHAATAAKGGRIEGIPNAARETAAAA